MAANFSISELTPLGLGSLYYYNSGGLLFSLGYFVVYYARFNFKDDDFYSKDGEGVRRRVITTESGTFDWRLFGYYTIGALLQFSVYTTICMTFLYSKRANLNIGIPSSLWAINPFLVACMDRIINGTPLKFYQLFGMGWMMVAAVIISLSNLK